MYKRENLHAITNAGTNGGNFYFYYNAGADTVTTSGYFNDVRLSVGDVVMCYNGSSINSYKVTANTANAKTVTLIATDTKAVWGSVTGTMSNQTDLNTALNGKFDKPTAPTAASVSTRPNAAETFLMLAVLTCALTLFLYEVVPFSINIIRLVFCETKRGFGKTRQYWEV